ncbi:alkyldihydroxyacetonephosphate synthase, partial [Sulfolobus sp. F1]
GSSVVGGAYHNKDCVVLDLSDLNKVIEFNEEDLTVTVEAGIKIKDLESWLNNKGYTLDYHPQSFYLATIGGAIAHKGSGSHSSSNIEELVLWLEVILPNGEKIEVGPNKSIRNSMGPELMHLFIGSEGRLGIITKAKLRVKPLANYYKDLAFYFDTFEDAIRFAREYTIHVHPPYRAVIHDNESGSYMLGLPYSISLIRLREYDQELVNAEESIVKKIARSYNGKEGEPELVKKWREVFAKKYEEQLLYLVTQGYWNDTLDLAISWSELPKMYRELRKSIMSLSGVYNVLSRLSHLYMNGSSLYVVVIFKQDPELLEKIWETTAKVVLKYGGTISHHHGVGFLKKKWIGEEKKDEIRLFNIIRNYLDENGVMNKGKLID